MNWPDCSVTRNDVCIARTRRKRRKTLQLLKLLHLLPQRLNRRRRKRKESVLIAARRVISRLTKSTVTTALFFSGPSPKRDASKPPANLNGSMARRFATLSYVRNIYEFRTNSLIIVNAPCSTARSSKTTIRRQMVALVLFVPPTLGRAFDLDQKSHLNIPAYREHSLRKRCIILRKPLFSISTLALHCVDGKFAYLSFSEAFLGVLFEKERSVEQAKIGSVYRRLFVG